MYGTLLILHQRMTDVTFAGLKLAVVYYLWNCVDRSKTLGPPRGYGSVGYDLADELEMALVLHVQLSPSCPYY